MTVGRGSNGHPVEPHGQTHRVNWSKLRGPVEDARRGDPMQVTVSRTQLTAFKTAAWQTKDAAEIYHSRTLNAPELFQIVRHDLFLRYVQRYAPAGARVLDLGCGTGLLSYALYDLGYDVVACDASQAMLDQLSAGGGDRKIELRLGNGFDIPAATGEFDLVVSRMFMQHFADWVLILREKARVTRSQGRVLFDFGNREHVELSFPNPVFQDDFPYSTDAAVPARYYAVCSEKEMQTAAAECGLEVEAIIPHGFLLNNIHFWNQVGRNGVDDFNCKLNELLADEGARKLLLFMEESFIAKLPKWSSYGNITVLRRAP